MLLSESITVEFLSAESISPAVNPCAGRVGPDISQSFNRGLVSQGHRVSLAPLELFKMLMIVLYEADDVSMQTIVVSQKKWKPDWNDEYNNDHCFHRF
jgi:hypothetical protein